MSTTIDKKIVEMRFNNADFERKAAQSMQTVDKLKQSLKFDDSGDAIERIAKSVERLEQRFSAFGIIGKRVIENITDSVINLEKRFTGFIINGVRSGGISRAMNLENARFTMQGLLKDEQAVSKVMNAVSASVDGTAYSLDQAATIAAQFVASGKQADEIEGALKGVAGAAAVTNSDFSSMGRIFAQVAGQGRLMGNDLLQLSTRGLNAAATLSDFFNAINKGDESVKNVAEEVQETVKTISAGMEMNEASIRDLVSKGQMSFDIFAAAMNNAFADQAAKANDTFTGSLSNIKAALARIGADFVSPLIEQKGPFVNLFNTIREKVNEVKKILTTDKSLGNFLSPAATFVNSASKAIAKLDDKVKNLNFKKIIRPMYNIIFAIQNIKNAISSVIKIGKDSFASIFPKTTVGKTITTITGKIEQLTKKLTPSAETADRLSRIFKGFFSLIKIGVNFVKSFIKVLGPGLGGAFKIGVDSILEFVARIGDAITWVQKWLVESKTFEKTFIIIRDVIGFVVDSIVWIGDKVGAVFDWIISKAVKFKDDLGGGFLHAFGELFKGIGKDIWNLAKGIKNDIVNIWNGVSVTGPLAGIKRFLQGIHDAFAGNPVFDFIVGLFKTLKEKIQSVINSFTGIDLSGAGGFMEKLKSKFSWLAVLIDFFKAVGHALKEVGKVVINILKSLGHAITDTLEAVLPGITESLNNIGSGGSFAVGVGAGAGIGAFIYGIVKQLHSIKSAEDVVNTLKKIVGQISGIFGSMQKAIDSFAIKNIAHSIALMAGSLFVLAMIPTERLLKGIVAISALTYALTTAMKAFGQMNKSTSGGDKGGKGKKGPLGFLTSITAGLNTMGVQLIAFASAIAILTGVIGILGHFSYDTLVKGLTAIIFMIRVISKEAHSLASAGGAAAATILAFAFAINALILPMIALAAILKLDPTIFLYGGGAIAAIMLSMGLVVDMIGKMTKEASPGALKASALVIVAIGAAMTAITVALAGLMATMVGFEASVGGKNWGVAIDSSPVLRMALGLGIIVSTIAAIAGTVKSLVKTANSIEDPKQVAIVGALFLGIGLVVAAIIKVLGQVTKLGKVGGQFTAIVILKGVNKILSTFSTLFKNIAEIGKASKDARKNVKSMATSALVLSAAVAVIVACMVELAKMRLSDILKTATTIVAIMGVLVGITVIMGKFQVVQKGILTLSTMLVAISGSAVLFSAAVWMIIEALEELGNQSPRHIDRMLENMGKFLDGLSDMIPKLAWMAGEMVGAFILTIVSAIVNSRAAIFEGIMQLVTTTLAELASNMPAIVNNLVKVVDALVNNIVPQLGHIADQLVILAIGLIKAIAKAIDNHASEILDAVDRLIGSVAKLAAETIARLLNKQGSELEEFVKKLGPGLKMILKYLVAIKSVGFVSNLLKMGKKDKDGGGIIQTFKNISNTIKTTKGNLALTEGGVRGLGEALQRTGEMSAEAGEKGAGAVGSIAGALGKVLSFLGPHGLIAVGAIAASVAIGFAIKGIIDAMTDATKVADTYTSSMMEAERSIAERHARVMNGMSEWQKEWASDMQDLQKTSFKDPVQDIDEYIEKLESLVTSSGHVKKGMEDEAQTLVNKLNPELGNILEIEDGVLEVNEKRIQSYKDLETEMDNYIQKLRAETTLSRYQSKYEDASEHIREQQQRRIDQRGWLENTEKNIAKQFKDWGFKSDSIDAVDKAIEDLTSIVYSDALGEIRFEDLKKKHSDQYKVLKDAMDTLGVSMPKDQKKYVRTLQSLFDDGGKLSGVAEYLADKKVTLEGFRTGLEKIEQEISQADNMMDNYEALSAAVASGEWDQVDELTQKIENDLLDRTHATEEQLANQYDASVEHSEDLIKLSKDTTARITEEEVEGAKQRLKIAFDEWKARASMDGAIPNEVLKGRKKALDDNIAALDKIKTTSEEAAEATGDWMSKLTMGASTKIGNLKNFDISGALDALKGKTNISADDLLGMTAGELNSMMSDYGLDAGDYLVTGKTKGIRDNTYKSEEAIDDWVYATNKRYKTDQGIMSPSKVYAKYGKYLVMGLANGITDNVNLAKNAMLTLASSTLLGLTSVIASQGQVGIKPIVDLSAIQNGSLQRSLNGQNLALNGNVSSQIAASINSVEFEAQIDKLAERLSSMHADMIIIANNNMKGLNQLAKSINGMQVVMDSRALVGQIAAPMDSALGGIAVLKNRG